jgi:hypothetical protein
MPQSKKDKKELARRQKEDQKDLERLERGEESPERKRPPLSRQEMMAKRAGSLNQFRSSSVSTRVLRSHYDDQVELRGQTARSSLSVSGGTAEATTETLSSEGYMLDPSEDYMENGDAVWNYLAQERERKQKGNQERSRINQDNMDQGAWSPVRTSTPEREEGRSNGTSSGVRSTNTTSAS